jgi:Arc/MetJ-type ribon-helix-helix transcriptional regulator
MAEDKNSISIMIRVSPEIDRQILELVTQDKHTTKSDVVKTALMEYLGRAKYFKDFRNQFLVEMDDPEARNKIKEIVREIFSEV